MSKKYLKLSMTKSELMILIHLYLFYPKATTSMYLLGLKTKTSSLIFLFYYFTLSPSANSVSALKYILTGTSPHDHHHHRPGPICPRPSLGPLRCPTRQSPMSSHVPPYSPFALERPAKPLKVISPSKEFPSHLK